MECTTLMLVVNHETIFNPSHHRETSFKSENIEVDRKTDARVTSKEMHTIYVPSEISTIKVLNEINQDNKSEAYDDATRFSSTQSLHQDTNFKCENVEGVSANVNNNSSSKISDNKIVPLSKSTFVKSNCSILDKNNGLTHTIESTTSIKLVARDIDDDDERRDDEEEEEDDELTRKVEEFIQKVNRCWKEEKLNA
ncbi:transcription initiation factor IIA large subunit-like [Solanum verrucosum]|uniref:transcription initiation factor IIA large subunit-like n=1 Tax=Solanum verrucosum TaxID=315347 RepID=UPI0020D0C39D|nr:transcription initiation factor IIA large subunit-like [Solanum verrucosum]